MAPRRQFLLAAMLVPLVVALPAPTRWRSTGCPRPAMGRGQAQRSPYFETFHDDPRLDLAIYYVWHDLPSEPQTLAQIADNVRSQQQGDEGPGLAPATPLPGGLLTDSEVGHALCFWRDLGVAEVSRG